MVFTILKKASYTPLNLRKVKPLLLTFNSLTMSESVMNMKNANTKLWIEKSGDDFPLYNGKPNNINAYQWVTLLASVALGFAFLSMKIDVLNGTFGGIARSTLFFAVPLTVFYLITNKEVTTLFRKLRWRDARVMISIALVNLLVTIALGALFLNTLGADTNTAVGALKYLSNHERLLFFVQSLPQLFGEEVLTVLPFLAFLHFSYRYLGLSKTRSVLLAWLLSSLVFGLVHLPTYNWNWLQCIIVIGSARLILTLAYIRTKNIWVSTGAHIINDWVIFSLVMIAH